jgi:NitT/TauT family transport system ATP-binding protein
MPILTAESVDFSWSESEALLLSNIQLELDSEQTAVIVGRSGCGKTTLCKLIAGLLRPTRGEVTFASERVLQPRREIAIVFQDYPYFPWLTVLKNARFGVDHGGGAGLFRDGEHVHSILAVLGLADKLEKFPHELSGGMRQRLSLARALAVRPSVLVLDEPFSALDVITKETQIQLIRELQGSYGFALLCVLHHLEDAYDMGGRSIVLGGGSTSTILGTIDPSAAPLQEYRAEVLSIMRSGPRRTGVRP